MFILSAEKSALHVTRQEALASGSAGVYGVRFAFSPEWKGFKRTAVFRVRGESRSVLLDSMDACTIPWEVLTAPGAHLFAGVYGTDGQGSTLPTIWADLGLILEGASPGENTRPPTPELWQQALDRIHDPAEAITKPELEEILL